MASQDTVVGQSGPGLPLAPQRDNRQLLWDFLHKPYKDFIIWIYLSLKYTAEFARELLPVGITTEGNLTECKFVFCFADSRPKCPKL